MIEINYFWHGKSFSNLEILTFTSAWKNNHQPVIWTYEGEIKGAPSFIKLKDATTLIPRGKFDYFLNELKLPIANISDIVRYAILIKYGGIYSDTDIVILKNLAHIRDEEYFCSTFEYIYGELANGCLFKLKANSEIAHYLSSQCELRIKEIELKRNIKFDYCYLGPFLIQQCAVEKQISILSYDVINPISWRWVSKIIAFEKPDYKFIVKNILRILLQKDTRGYRVTKNTFAIHLSNEVWRHQFLDKNKTFHKWSKYEMLKRKYLK